MEIEDIAALSMNRSMAAASTSVDIAVTKKVMELEQVLAAQMLASLEATMPTRLASFGHKLDVLA